VTIEDDIGFSSVCPHRVYFFLWLAKLVPNAKRITNPNSGHEIHKEQPLTSNRSYQIEVATRPGHTDRLSRATLNSRGATTSSPGACKDD